MSDTDDGFDEEAVRRELREKYEDDDRGETERMSELLLQGATMTNEHCDACGSPIFRYDGQSFCPNCQHAAQQTQQGGQQAAGDQQSQQVQQPQQSQHAQQPQQTQNDAKQPQQNTRAADSARTEAAASVDADEGFVADVDASAVEQRDDARRSPPSATDTSDSNPPSEAAAALESAVAAMARRAAASDDPRRAREHLEAAHEAAQALATLRHNA